MELAKKAEDTGKVQHLEEIVVSPQEAPTTDATRLASPPPPLKRKAIDVEESSSEVLRKTLRTGEPSSSRPRGPHGEFRYPVVKVGSITLPSSSVLKIWVKPIALFGTSMRI